MTAPRPAAREGVTKFAYGRYGLVCDPRGAHVTLAWNGRVLLGEVLGAGWDEATGGTRLTVRHFNGEPWPVEPMASAVDVLVRDYTPGPARVGR